MYSDRSDWRLRLNDIRDSTEKIINLRMTDKETELQCPSTT